LSVGEVPNRLACCSDHYPFGSGRRLTDFGQRQRWIFRRRSSDHYPFGSGRRLTDFGHCRRWISRQRCSGHYPFGSGWRQTSFGQRWRWISRRRCSGHYPFGSERVRSNSIQRTIPYLFSRLHESLR